MSTKEINDVYAGPYIDSLNFGALNIDLDSIVFFKYEKLNEQNGLHGKQRDYKIYYKIKLGDHRESEVFDEMVSFFVNDNYWKSERGNVEKNIIELKKIFGVNNLDEELILTIVSELEDWATLNIKTVYINDYDVENRFGIDDAQAKKLFAQIERAAASAGHEIEYTSGINCDSFSECFVDDILYNEFKPVGAKNA